VIPARGNRAIVQLGKESASDREASQHLVEGARTDERDRDLSVKQSGGENLVRRVPRNVPAGFLGRARCASAF
jgi:hypothetical protein